MRFVLYEYAVDTVTALNAAMASIVAANYAAVNVLFVDVGLGYLRQIWGTMTRRHDNNMMKGGGVAVLAVCRRDGCRTEAGLYCSPRLISDL